MGTRGPKKKPANGLHYANGAPPAPKWLSSSAKAEYARVVKLMGQVVQKTDLAVLSAYAHSWAEWQKESQLLDREGTITTGAQGQPIQNPRCRVVKDLFNIMAAAASKLGFSPADRDRMKPKEVEKKKNPLEALNA